MFWGIFYKIYNFCSRRSKFITTIRPNKLFIDRNNSLKIVSYNIDGLFLHYNHNNYVNISKYIRYLFTDEKIDIICLQEVWEKNIYDLIIKNLNDLNLFHTFPPTSKKYCVGEHSGLLIISKYPIILSDFEIYDKSNFTCLMTNKGIQYVTIKVNNDYISLINTHLQSSFNRYNLQYQNTTINQINFIKDYLIKYNIKNCLIIGDFNLKEEYMDLFLHDNSEFKVPYNYKNLVSLAKENELLDYFVFYNDIFQDKKINFKICNNIYYSDHYPIMININKNLRNKIIIEEN
tara:strand:+ start:463 stop:1332 length:870 start_codon:yes stop_codon:yes gene_type:complete